MGYVTHRTLADFAAEKVNLKRDAASEYRQQVQRLRDRLKEHIDAHPDYGFVKTRHSGSLAKGTALSTLNDMDLAVYVKAAEVPAAESDLLRWLEERLKKALKPPLSRPTALPPGQVRHRPARAPHRYLVHDRTGRSAPKFAPAVLRKLRDADARRRAS